MELKNHIEELKDGKFRLLSHDGKNLGTFDSRAAAEKHEREVEYFKHNDKPNTSEPDQQPELHNANDHAQIYYARHMEPGLCGYENEKILVDADAMKRMAPSFAGKPLFVGHQNVPIKNIEDEADGYVTDCFYNELDGWLWSKILVTSNKGMKAVNNGWSVSNAYVPMAWGGGGSHHNVDYNRKIGEAEFTHLAIVPDPRYENAKIFSPDEYKRYNEAKRTEINELRNSKRKPMFKFFKNEKKEISVNEVDDDTIVELQNGKTITVGEMNAALAEAEADPMLKKIAQYEALENAKKSMKKNDKEDTAGTKDEKEVEEDGEEKMNEAEEAEYKRLSEKKNRMKKNAEGEKDEKKNSTEPTAEEIKAFNELKNAKAAAAGTQYTGPKVDLDVDQLARGKARYGSETK